MPTQPERRNVGGTVAREPFESVESVESDDPEVSDAARELRRSLLTFGLGFGALFCGVWVLLYFQQAQVIALSEEFVRRFGGVGVAVGFFLPDAFTLPLPNDAFTIFGRLGGMSFWTVVAWGSLGSILGGSVGWAIGYWGLSRMPALRRYFERKGGVILERVQRAGLFALAAAALTPIPYSITCWAAGAVKMPYVHFVAISSLRVVRVAFYLWLIEIGVLSLALH